MVIRSKQSLIDTFTAHDFEIVWCKKYNVTHATDLLMSFVLKKKNIKYTVEKKLPQDDSPIGPPTQQPGTGGRPDDLVYFDQYGQDILQITERPVLPGHPTYQSPVDVSTELVSPPITTPTPNEIDCLILSDTDILDPEIRKESQHTISVNEERLPANALFTKREVIGWPSFELPEPRTHPK